MRILSIILGYLFAGVTLPVLPIIMIMQGRLGGHNDAGAGLLAMLVATGSLFVVTTCFVVHMIVLALQFKQGDDSVRKDVVVPMPSARYVFWAFALPIGWSCLAILLSGGGIPNEGKTMFQTEVFALCMLLPLAAFFMHLIVHLGFAWIKAPITINNDK